MNFFLYPSLAALVADPVPEHRRASVVGIFSSVFLLGNASGAFIFGYVAHAVATASCGRASPWCSSSAGS
jgi:MFS family permease